MSKNDKISLVITDDFEPTINELNEICTEKPHFKKSEIMRMAIKFWVMLYKASPKDRLKIAEKFINDKYYT